MKKTTIAILGILAAAVCGCEPKYKTDVKGRPVAVREDARDNANAAAKNSFAFTFADMPGFPAKLNYIMFDGHEYVAIRYDRGAGLAHSPRCSCGK